jgi:N-methylhydantoinase A
MLAAPLTREASRTLLADSTRTDLVNLLTAAFGELEAVARAELREEGAADRDTTAERWVDARYRGQSFELRVSADGWIDAFHRAHEERYGYARRGTPVEAVTLRVVAQAPGPELEATPLEASDAAPSVTRSRVRFRGKDLDCARVWRRDLRAGHALEGPLIVQEYSATTWVPPGWRLEVDGWGTLHLQAIGTIP